MPVRTEVVPGRPIRGYFSAADARAATLSEAQARILLFESKPASVAAVVLAATDIVLITGIVFMSAVTLVASLYDGSDDTIDAGERLWMSRHSAAGGNCSPIIFMPPLQCQAGTYPKIEADVTGQIDVMITGTVFNPSSSP